MSTLAVEEETRKRRLVYFVGFKWTAILFFIISQRSLLPLKRGRDVERGSEVKREGEGEGGRERDT